MLKAKLIIFDLDGVLANTEKFHMDATSEALAEQGFTKYTREYSEKYLAGKAIPLILDAVDKENKNQVNRDMFNESLIRIYKNFEDHITAIDGAEDFIKSLNIPFCVASASNLKQLHRTLDGINLKKYFNEKTIFSCFTYNKFKPDPTVYLEALKGMGFEAKDAVAIEDSIPGVQAAYGAKLRVIGFIGADYLKDRTKDYAPILLKNGAIATKKSYSELANFIMPIN